MIVHQSNACSIYYAIKAPDESWDKASLQSLLSHSLSLSPVIWSMAWCCWWTVTSAVLWIWWVPHIQLGHFWVYSESRSFFNGISSQGNPEEHTILEFARLIKSLVGRSSHLQSNACTPIHILYLFKHNLRLTGELFSAISSVDDYSIYSTWMVLFAQDISAVQHTFRSVSYKTVEEESAPFICSLLHSEPQSNPVPPGGSGRSTEEKTWHTEGQDDAWMGACGMCDTSSITLACTRTLNILLLQPQMGVCWRQTFIVWFTGGVFSERVGSESKLLSVFRESDCLLSAAELNHSHLQF